MVYYPQLPGVRGAYVAFSTIIKKKTEITTRHTQSYKKSPYRQVSTSERIVVVVGTVTFEQLDACKAESRCSDTQAHPGPSLTTEIILIFYYAEH